jgi:hypothetical protein
MLPNTPPSYSEIIEPSINHKNVQGFLDRINQKKQHVNAQSLLDQTNQTNQHENVQGFLDQINQKKQHVNAQSLLDQTNQHENVQRFLNQIDQKKQHVNAQSLLDQTNQTNQHENVQGFLDQINRKKQQKSIQKKKEEAFISDNVMSFINNIIPKKELFVHKKVFSILKLTQKEKDLSSVCDQQYRTPEEVIEIYENKIMQDGGKIPEQEQLRMIELRDAILQDPLVFNQVFTNAKIWKTLSVNQQGVISTILPTQYKLGKPGDWWETYDENTHNKNNPAQEKTFQTGDIINLGIGNLATAMKQLYTKDSSQKVLSFSPYVSNKAITKEWRKDWRNWTVSGLQYSQNSEYTQQLDEHLYSILTSIENKTYFDLHYILENDFVSDCYREYHTIQEDLIIAATLQYLSNPQQDFMHFNNNGFQRLHSLGVDDDPVDVYFKNKGPYLGSSCGKKHKHGSIGGSTGFSIMNNTHT